MLVGDQAGGRVGQAQSHAHFLHALAEGFLDLLDEVLVLAGFLLLLLLLCFIGKLAEIEFALGDRLQRFAFEFVQTADHPFVDTLSQQKDFDAFLAEHFEMRAVLGGSKSIGSNVVNLVLAFFHTRYVISKCHFLRLAIGQRGGKAQKLGNALAIGEILAYAFLEYTSEFLPEGREFVLVVLSQVFEHA